MFYVLYILNLINFQWCEGSREYLICLATYNTIYWTAAHGEMGKVETLGSRKRKEYSSLPNNCLSKQPHCLNIPITKGFLFEWGVLYVATTSLLIKIHTPNEFLAPLLVNMIT